MNEFKESIKEKAKQSNKENINDYQVQEVDKKISTNIIETLANTLENSDDKNEKVQILSRMLNINKLFREGFDKQMEKLKELEKDEKQQ